MSVRVRFAPSPTGYLHIGGARTAIYNYLYAKANKGTFVLRIEDTDTERSKREYEESQIKDLKWLGLTYDEGPDNPGEYGPYRQSERTEIYQKYANQLIDENKAFHCFCTDEQLDAKREEAIAQERSPHYDGTCRNISKEDALKRIESGEKATIRFKVPMKSYSLVDEVRGKVEFPEDMVGDFVIMRSNGLPVYNYCCVVDDWLMKITHVIRAEDHLPNTLRQLMIYEAFDATPPIFAHASLLVGHDRQKLSKRHGATSVNAYTADSYLPEALANYLCLLGWSHPDEENIFKLSDIENIFTSKRFSKAAALYDIEKLKWCNAQHLRSLDTKTLIKRSAEFIDKDSPYHEMNDEWKARFVELYKEKIDLFSQFNEKVSEVFGDEIEKTQELLEILSWETTGQIRTYLNEQIDSLISNSNEFATEEDIGNWINHVKKEMKIKGKPLFMGVRSNLTGKDHGPDLKVLATLTPLKTIKSRIEKIAGL